MESVLKPSPDRGQAWDELAKRFKALHSDNQPGKLPEDGVRVFPESLVNQPGPRTEGLLRERLNTIATSLVEKSQDDNGAYISNVWTCLADVSRDVPILRLLFGLQRRSSKTENDKQVDKLIAPDCVLEAARRVLFATKTALARGLRKQALRIIANCCADNDTNRALMIDRYGVEKLKSLAEEREELIVLLPTIYNVCVDYDMIAKGDDGKELRITEEMGELSVDQSAVALTVAEQALGKFNPGFQKTAMQIFLDLTTQVEESQHPVLADIIEMASRPALFGIEHVFDQHPDDLHQSKLESLFGALSSNAQSLALDQDPRASICQTYLNLLSQPTIQNFLSQSPTDLEAFIDLPYITEDVSLRNDAFTTAFLKITYSISSLPTCTETVTPRSGIVKRLTRRLNTGQIAPAPALVLLANSLTNTERVNEFQTSYHPHAKLVHILEYQTESFVILPTLGFCTRLALIPQGQVELYSAMILPAITILLTTEPRTEKNFEIHRESIALARLVVKSQPTHALSLLTDSAQLFTAIVGLASTTIDASSKLEAGRFVVEILRTLLSRSNTDPSTPSTLPTAYGSPSNSTASTEKTQDLESLTTPTAISSILFLITDAPSSAIRAEGMFGLGLLSTIPGKNIEHSIIQCLSEQKEKVLHVLKEIADASASAPIPQIANAGAGPGLVDTRPEIENLKFLLSYLLNRQPQPQPHSQPQQMIQAQSRATEGAITDRETEQQAPERALEQVQNRQQFRQELLLLAHKVGLAMYPGQPESK